MDVGVLRDSWSDVDGGPSRKSAKEAIEPLESRQAPVFSGGAGRGVGCSVVLGARGWRESGVGAVFGAG